MLIRNLARKRQIANSQIWVDDVFSTYLYTGNGTTQTITNGIDLAGYGGLVWCKNRTSATNNCLVDTVRGTNSELYSNLTNLSTAAGVYVTGFNLNGFSVGSGAPTNTGGENYASWTFRKAPKFFDLATVTKSSGSDATVSFDNLETLGMVFVKRIDSTGSWYVWHRSLTAGKLLYLEQIAAETTLGHITVSGTTVTLEDGVIADGTYIVYAYAHDDSEDGMIQCGSFTTDGSGNATVTLGWEPQWLILKTKNSNNNWYMIDNMRGLTVGTLSKYISPNLSIVENAIPISPTATGFQDNGAIAYNATIIYIAIRRSNKPPTTGTQVYNAIARTGTGATATVTGVGFSPDLAICHSRSGTTGGRSIDRLRGATNELVLEATSAEAAVAQSLLSFSMDGFNLGTDGDWNTTSATYINWLFKRAKGFFDIVCYTGTGVARTVNHNLGAVPELIIVKCRSNTAEWMVYDSSSGASYYSCINTTAAKIEDQGAWNNTTPTVSVFSLGNNWGQLNQSTYTYVAYLFASLPGISKIGSYTGNGTTQNIDMGFSAGCRFFLVKSSSTTGSWWLYDSVRGITAAADNALQLNSTAAEITTADAIDNYSAGITVNQETTCNINVNNATYIYMGIS